MKKNTKITTGLNSKNKNEEKSLSLKIQYYIKGERAKDVYSSLAKFPQKK